MKRDNVFVRFERAIAGMVVPEIRKTGSLPNAMWFLRNGIITNQHHPKFESAMSIAREIARFS
jgi:prophage antirepressor-like protein